MKITRVVPAALLLCLSAGVVTGQNTRFSDPDTVIRDELWGNLYAHGGSSFFCDRPFTAKGFTLTEGYVYPLADIRTALDCGTTSQCKRDNRYRQIASDLHNMVPVTSRIELRRRSVRYENLENASEPDDCGIRTSTHFFEPPVHAKGDVARTMAYMVTTYDLPWLGSTALFQGWSELDPPDDGELSRHNQIAEIQGNENPFVVNPGLINRL